MGALATLLEQCVRTEGPIHMERAMQRVARCYAIERVTRPVRERMTWGIRYACRTGPLALRGEFLWILQNC